MESLSRSSSPLFSSIFHTATASAEDELSWDELNALLEQSFEENKTGRTDPDRLARIQSIIVEISLKSSLSDQIKLLKLFERHTFYHTNKFFETVLCQIAKENPEITEYFSLGDPIITPKGVSQIFKFFETAYDEFPKDCLSCQTVSDLPGLIEEILNSRESRIMKGFVITNPPDDPHLSPIFILKTGSTVQILSSDSKGHEISSKARVYDMCKALEIIKNKFSRKFKYFDNLEIFSCKLKRQKDIVSCPIFSILDLKNLVERHREDGDTIFDFFKSCTSTRLIMHEMMDDSDLKLSEIGLLPPEMMKVTQSYSDLATYASHSPELTACRSPSFIRKSPEGAPVFSTQTMDVLTASVMRAKCMSPRSHPVSKYVDKKRWGFIITILESHFRDRGLLPFVDEPSLLESAEWH